MPALRPASRTRPRTGRGRAARAALVLLAVLLAVLPLLDWFHEGDHGCADRSVACFSTAPSPDFDPPVPASAVSGWDRAPGTSVALLVTALGAVAFAASRDRRSAGASGVVTILAAGTGVVGGAAALDHVAHHQLVTTPVLQGGLPTTGTWLWDVSLPAILSLVAALVVAVVVAVVFHADRPRARPAGPARRRARGTPSTANPTVGRFLARGRRATPPASRRRAHDERRSTP